MPADPLARSAPAGDVADSAQRWQRVKQIVGDALELPVEDRERFVKAACDLDPALLKEVEEMLRACTEAEGFLEQPPPLPTPVSATDIELAIRPGQWVGPFQIQELLGRGGMGVVFRAQDPKLQREVALKFLTAALAADEKAHQRLYREARILSCCRHPGIPLLYDICDYSGYTFLVMELLEGHALSEQPEQPLACATLVRLALQVCEVLSCAHAQGIIHRDIKPANIFLDRSGHVKVLDFGIAKLASRDPGNRHIQLTESRAALGTISYLSPEQARGEEVDPRSDLFSLGAVLFELATGQRAFSGATHAVIFNEILSKTVPAPSSLRPELPRQLDRIISKLLEKDPRQRYQSAAEVQAELGILLNSLENTNPSVIFRPDYRALVWLVSASFVAALSVGLLWRANHSRTDHRRHEPAALVSDTPPSVAAGRRSVAVLGFKDLKASSETAWLSTALSEMLSTELAAGPSLRVISGEEIAHLKSDLVLREGESYSAPTLRRIQQRVGSDLVVVGSYLDAGPSQGGEVRLDLQVQDAHRGETVATVSETGRDTQLLSLISQTGSDLRTRLGLADAPPGALDGLKAYISPDPEAARLYAEGLDRLRLFEYRDAQQLLKRAVERDPASPVAHAALAEAWSHLGSDEKAREQAKAAFDASKGMLREGRLWMEGQYRMAAHQYDRAAQIYQALFAIAPDNLDYGLRLSAARVASGRPSEALAATKALRQLPVPLRDDPRIDLAEADAINITGPIGVELKLAEQAAAKARQSGSRVLVEQASLKRANCLKRLGRYREALSAMGEARRIANVLGDVPGQAFAARQLGNALFNHGDLAEAQETLAEARALYRRAGDQTGEAFALNYFAMVQGREGDLGGALSSLRDSLALARRGGSTFLVAAGLKSLAQIAQLQGQLADAEKTYAQAQSLSRASGFQLLLEEIL
ncbi:MAG: protein kinase, partial [Acidobacteria bacterium]|nr:protein kinase [Acidobacteriota bacterium]